jgi:hypothetical protein
MDPSPSCPSCNSLDVGEYGSDRNLVIWCICYQCTNLWVRTPSATETLDHAGSSKRGSIGLANLSIREMTDLISRELDEALMALKRVRA